MPASLKDFTVVSSPTPAQPTTANTLLSWMSLLAQLAALVVSNRESQSAICRVLPFTPPCSLIMLKYERTVSRSTVASTGPASSTRPQNSCNYSVRSTTVATPRPAAPLTATTP